MIALLGFVTGPIGRYVVGAVAVLAIVAGIYFKGSSNAHKSDAAAIVANEAAARTRSDSAGVSYDADGAASRLRAGKY